MAEPFIIRTMRPGEEQDVCDLVRRVFAATISQAFTDDGEREFFRFANPEAMRTRLRSGSLVLVGVLVDRRIGMLELVPPAHLALMFGLLRGRGLGRAMLTHAMARVRAERPGVSKVTVHAALGAEPAYRALGFHAAGPRTTENGITFMPMALTL